MTSSSYQNRNPSPFLFPATFTPPSSSASSCLNNRNLPYGHCPDWWLVWVCNALAPLDRICQQCRPTAHMYKRTHSIQKTHSIVQNLSNMQIHSARLYAYMRGSMFSHVRSMHAYAQRYLAHTRERKGISLSNMRYLATQHEDKHCETTQSDCVLFVRHYRVLPPSYPPARN